MGLGAARRRALHPSAGRTVRPDRNRGPDHTAGPDRKEGPGHSRGPDRTGGLTIGRGLGIAGGLTIGRSLTVRRGLTVGRRLGIAGGLTVRRCLTVRRGLLVMTLLGVPLPAITLLPGLRLPPGALVIRTSVPALLVRRRFGPARGARARRRPCWAVCWVIGRILRRAHGDSLTSCENGRTRTRPARVVMSGLIQSRHPSDQRISDHPHRVRGSGTGQPAPSATTPRRSATTASPATCPTVPAATPCSWSSRSIT